MVEINFENYKMETLVNAGSSNFDVRAENQTTK